MKNQFNISENSEIRQQLLLLTILNPYLWIHEAIYLSMYRTYNKQDNLGTAAVLPALPLHKIFISFNDTFFNQTQVIRRIEISKL